MFETQPKMMNLVIVYEKTQFGTRTTYFIAVLEFDSFHLFLLNPEVVCGKCFHSAFSHLAWKWCKIFHALPDQHTLGFQLSLGHQRCTSDTLLMLTTMFELIPLWYIALIFEICLNAMKCYETQPKIMNLVIVYEKTQFRTRTTYFIAVLEFDSFHLFWLNTEVVCGKCFHSAFSHLAWKWCKIFHALPDKHTLGFQLSLGHQRCTSDTLLLLTTMFELIPLWYTGLNF